MNIPVLLVLAAAGLLARAQLVLFSQFAACIEALRSTVATEQGPAARSGPPVARTIVQALDIGTECRV